MGENSKYKKSELSSASNNNWICRNTLIILYKNTLIGIEPRLFLTKTALCVSIVLKVFLLYMYDVIIDQPVKILKSTAAIY